MPDFISKDIHPQDYENTVSRVISYLKTGHCIPFLGAGASIPDPKPPAAEKVQTDEASRDRSPAEKVQTEVASSDQTIPSGTGMAEEFARELGIDPMIQIPLPIVSFLFERFRSRKDLTTYIVSRLTGGPPSETHSILAKVLVYLHRSPEMKSVELMISTNYDQQLEHELIHLNRELALRPPIKINCIMPSTPGQQIQQWEEDSLNLLKLHGCVSNSAGLIVTDEDYIKILNMLGGSAGTKFIDVTILGKIPMASLLFLGYSLGDWDFRAFYESLMQDRSPSKKYVSYAIQLRPVNPKEARKWDVTSRYWQGKGIQVIDSLASDFLSDVYCKMNPDARRP